ncbi:hypothetical protein BL124_00023030 [Klebsiella pneumoniae]|uniref:Uncharacterized protein n=1 Tax=Klebsiella pneumoniae TaxID=573 RepID=A0A422ZKN5_KLEPN|nr:hypothetical protein BL124_00023030 [Klebsiella pneumoniae]
MALFLRLSRCDICFRFSPGGRKTGERNPVFNLLHRDGLCRADTTARRKAEDAGATPEAAAQI